MFFCDLFTARVCVSFFKLWILDLGDRLLERDFTFFLLLGSIGLVMAAAGAFKRERLGNLSLLGVFN